MIDKHQSAFLRGKGMLDKVLIANEIVNFLKNEKLRGVIVKVVYEKAYDSTDWEFLVSMMGKLGFPIISGSIGLKHV